MSYRGDTAEMLLEEREAVRRYKLKTLLNEADISEDRRWELLAYAHSPHLPCEEELEDIRFDLAGEAVATALIGIGTLRDMSRPIASKGGYRLARVGLLFILTASGFIAGAEQSSVALALLGAATGFACATVIGLYWLKGLPSVANAYAHLRSPRVVRKYQLIAEKTGPSPAVTAAQALREA